MNKEQLMYLITKVVTDLSRIKIPDHVIYIDDNGLIMVYTVEEDYTLDAFSQEELKSMWDLIELKHPTTVHKHLLVFDREPEVNPEL